MTWPTIITGALTDAFLWVVAVKAAIWYARNSQELT